MKDLFLMEVVQSCVRLMILESFHALLLVKIARC